MNKDEKKEEEIIQVYRCEKCDKSFKSYQGIYGHNKRHHEGEKPEPATLLSPLEFTEKGWKFGSFGRPKAGESIKEKQTKKVFEKIEEITANIDEEKPNYLSEDFVINEVNIPQEDSIPSVVKLLNVGESLDDEEEEVLSKQRLKFQGKLARHFFQFADSLLTIFGKGYTGDNDYEIKRNKSDYDLLEDTTKAMMEEQQVFIPYSATAVWGITVGIAYGTPVAKMGAKRRKKGWKLIPNLRFWGKKKVDDLEEMR